MQKWGPMQQRQLQPVAVAVAVALLSARASIWWRCVPMSSCPFGFNRWHTWMPDKGIATAQARAQELWLCKECVRS